MATQQGLKAEDPEREKKAAIIEAWAVLYGGNQVEVKDVTEDLRTLRSAPDGIDPFEGEERRAFRRDGTHHAQGGSRRPLAGS